ncbi:hypothetical protein BTUL_0011g00030 [Botrytis tulipae]|uniref:Uncharacterized protein n=1 Tax=Botrytis tulipae TaxID=87230 RepID=A0A4Z1F3S2_9HELO|nr:hypothetical protein BTUL_0011g00030 [Botrytis tulipae]
MVFITPDDSKEKANVATNCWAVTGSGPATYVDSRSPGGYIDSPRHIYGASRGISVQAEQTVVEYTKCRRM